MAALIPAPADPTVLVAFFESERAGCDAVLEVIGSGQRPAAIEFLDGTAFGAAAATYPGDAPSTPAFVLIAEQHGPADDLAAIFGGPLDRPDPAALWRWRDTVHGAVTSLRGGKVSEDVAVPVERLAEALDGLREIGDAHGLETCAWGHAGDGNLHATFMVSPDEAERAERAAADLFDVAIELGGTVTGEHGIGWLKRGRVPAAAGLNAAVKAAFDPKGLFNPGKKG